MIEQIKETGRNNDSTLGIPGENLELKHYVHNMFIACSFVHNLFQFGPMINH